MGLLRLVEFSREDIVREWGEIPEPGTRFEFGGQLYECVMLNLSTVYAVPDA